MSDTYKGFGPRSSKATFPDTLARAIQVVRSGSGDNGPIVVTAHPTTLAGITAPLGVTLKADNRVPVGNCWISVGTLDDGGAA